MRALDLGNLFEMKLFAPAMKIGAFVMLMWGGVMLVPVLISMDNWAESVDFISSAACCYLLSLVLYYFGRKSPKHMQPRALFMITAFNWILLCVTGTLPYYFSDLDISFTDSLFESVSGVTTTGSSIFSDIESLPKGVLMYRSLTQWVGGIGIILVAVAILPSLKIGGMRLFRSEFSEWSQLDANRISKIAGHIIVVYFLISLTCLLAYRGFGMTWFDAANHMMATVSTGGFSTWNNSFGHFNSSHLQAISSIFMLLGACPFLLIVISFEKRNLTFLRDRQVRLLFKLILLNVLLISLWRYFVEDVPNMLRILESSAFNTISIITTTGFASEDYGLWGTMPVMILSFLMFSGGCSGSTSGGVKLFRYQLLAIFMKEHVQRALHPEITASRHYNDRPVGDDVLVASLAYFFCVIISWSVSACLVAATGVDPVTSITGSLSALMNVGPGFGEVIGPVGNYSSLPQLAKYVLSADMLLGRLEFLALVIIFTREYWKW
jgi:trk system potassium uptake protein TrkH